ncbi:MAG: hypothetical protein IT260_00135 [Saprospiraceae bacterium]|nr:hypothetical protein [Saprospiraceae bacterium]
MDFLKAKIYLDKINRDFARMHKDPENVLRIDVDIIMANVRELYDALLSEADASAQAVKEVVHKKHSTHNQPEPPAPVAAPPVVVPPPPVVVMPPAPAPAPPTPAPPPVVVEPIAEVAPPPEEKPAPAPPPPPVMVEAIKPADPLPIVKPAAPAPVSPPSFPAVSPDAEALFEQKQAKELSEKLSELPIPDLRKAIALNDRLLLTRELFGGDNQAFENAINALNGFQSMDQAKAYLLDYCVMRYRWTDKKHVETAKNFIKLVRRRFN